MGDTFGMVAVVILIGLVGIGIITAAAVYDALEWDRFKTAHNCKVIGGISGSSSVGVGIGSNGGVAVVPVYTPGKTGWACDDGKQYWR